MNIVKTSVARRYAQAKGFRISECFTDEINEKTMELIDAAMRRSEKNGRSTLMARDL